jgi:hypothetical protein
VVKIGKPTVEKEFALPLEGPGLGITFDEELETPQYIAGLTG